MLVVDDDRDIAELIQTILIDEGLRVSCLYDLERAGFEAVVERLEPACVILDGSAAKEYGPSWELARWLSERSPQVPCVMLTAHRADREEAMLDESARARASRVTAVIPKPFDIDRLITVVRSAAGQGVTMLSDRAEADSARELATRLTALGARELAQSRIGRVWATFRGADEDLYKIYRWRASDVWFIGRYDAAGIRLEPLGQFGDLEALIAFCARRIGRNGDTR